ncbi:LysE family translocator [Trinickia diaoshuihuensis]|jgi:threonine/homoserine/homoserine lactone efflux protein|uniref:LysE family translocator n=1 Tax=Trinickia diaoshuihuensis TaxID=2292265 RepID=UPI000E2327CF|nr:LysE family transporter [Trinickia diaoshuihuensis]
MHYLPILAQIAVIYFVAAASPGPNFFMVTQLSLAGRRGLGAASALGVCTASMLWVTLAMLGLSAVLQRLEWIDTGVRVAGALYLIYFGLKLLRSSARRDLAPTASARAAQPVAHDAAAWLRAYRSGFVTCATNPKSCAFWTSVFAAMFPKHPPMWFYGAVFATVGSLSASWYCGMAFMFATERTQRGYRKLRRPIDAFCGAALVGLGAKLVAER